MLRHWALLSRDLWFELLHRDRPTCFWENSLLEIYKVMRVLCDYGLVETTPQTEDLEAPWGYWMHRSVHSWMNHHYISSPQLGNVCWYLYTILSESRHSKCFRHMLPHVDKCYEHLLARFDWNGIRGKT